MVSEISDTLSKLSREFAFDSAVLATRVYASQSAALIALLRRRVQKGSPTQLYTEKANEAFVSTDASPQQHQGILERDVHERSGFYSKIGDREKTILCKEMWVTERSLSRAHIHVTSASVLPLQWLVDARFQRRRARTSKEHTDNVSATSTAFIDLSAAGHLLSTPYLFSAPSACDDAAYNWVHIGRRRLSSGLFQPVSVFYVLDLPTQNEDNLSGLLTKVRASIAATLVEQPDPVSQTLYFIAIVLQRGRRGMLDFGSQMQLETFRAEAQTLYKNLCVDFTVPDRDMFWNSPWEHIRAIDSRARTDELNGHCFFGRSCTDWGARPMHYQTPMSNWSSAWAYPCEDVLLDSEN